ncbi:hypothetical protein J1N35_031513 [Gossypium stocksii]|uniref:Uncharacterized protein n=1 Tax=Gossypium stocksii TaxID=47602 RepID=A0A9D3V1Q3_9ROSI|nr:hypothetical protein J1N35_031513 [Gossypium stocksii]
MKEMSGQNTSHTFANNATSQAQLARDEMLNQGSQASDRTSSYTSQATNLLQQTGEQVKNIAQGAADAVKNTLGMNKPTSTDHPSNPSPPRT